MQLISRLKNVRNRSSSDYASKGFDQRLIVAWPMRLFLKASSGAADAGEAPIRVGVMFRFLIWISSSLDLLS